MNTELELKKPLSYGVYRATPEFRAIELHSCVCYENLGLVAVTGRADDELSQAYAELFANAPVTAKYLDDAVALLKKVLPLISRSRRIIQQQSTVPHLIEDSLMAVDIEIDDFLNDFTELKTLGKSK